MTSLEFLLNALPPKDSTTSFSADGLETEHFPALWVLIIFQPAYPNNYSLAGFMKSHLMRQSLTFSQGSSGSLCRFLELIFPCSLFSDVLPYKSELPQPPLTSISLQFSETTVLSLDFSNLHHSLENVSRSKAGVTKRLISFVSLLSRIKALYCSLYNV